MMRLDVGHAFQVGNGAGEYDASRAVEGAGAHAQLGHGGAQ